MSKIVYMCYRDATCDHHDRADIECLARRLTPGNIEPIAPVIAEHDGILLAGFSIRASMRIKNGSVCLGGMIEGESNWWEPGVEPPDGTYTLFRSNATTVEVLSDMMASRTVWYVKTETMFIASTSQRAIVFLLQDYVPNMSTYPWMLSSGTLGLGLSWDRRIQYLRGNACLVLDRPSWQLRVSVTPVPFQPRESSEREHERRLQETIESIFQKLPIDLNDWVLPLSGGHDSRAILLMLKDRPGLRTITWGLKSELKNKRSDAYVAKEVANYFGVAHEYFETDLSNEPVEVVFDRFLVAGEGRVDHAAAYMDGFRVWKLLHERNVTGIIRGDHGFGRFSTRSALDARLVTGALLFTDYMNLGAAEDYGLEKQELPETLMQKDESPEAYRERLYYEFRMPVALAALNDLKYPYVQVISPLLSRTLVKIVTELPAELRTNKRVYKKITRSIGPDIRFAKYAAVARLKDILKNPRVVEVLMDELNTQDARALLSDRLISYITSNVTVLDSTASANKRRSLIPGRITQRLRRTTKVVMDCNVLAFRAYMICRMNRLLLADARSGKQRRQKIAAPV